MILFDATSYANKPDLRPRGIYPCVCETWVNPGETPEQAVLRWAQRAYDTRAMLCFDFELDQARLKLDPYAPWVEAELDRWNHYIDVARAAYPTLLIGNFDSPKFWREKFSYGKSNWRGLADRLNFAAPELYHYKADDGRMQTDEEWQAMASERIDATRDFNRPTYGFVNTTRWDAPWEPVEGDRLKRMLAWLDGKVDGVVWWGGGYYEGETWRQRQFSEADAWVNL